ncbi:hypothetical protein CO615_04135 [Lysobacteraceae bacterium NML75-0749]|nr:hypothetical protein CO615_04135 [Xanthomonadaceae bacterium NML75-0749]
MSDFGEMDDASKEDGRKGEDNPMPTPAPDNDYGRWALHKEYIEDMRSRRKQREDYLPRFIRIVTCTLFGIGVIFFLVFLSIFCEKIGGSNAAVVIVSIIISSSTIFLSVILGVVKFVLGERSHKAQERQDDDIKHPYAGVLGEILEALKSMVKK